LLFKNRYKVEKCLKKDKVYKCLDIITREMVIVKKGCSVYEKEAIMRCRGIIEMRLLDKIEENTLVLSYVCGEKIDGRSLNKEILVEIIKKIKEIHKKGIAHLDLKEENIIILGKEVQIIDFGSARQIGSKSKKINATIGYFKICKYKNKFEAIKEDDYFAVNKLAKKHLNEQVDIKSGEIISNTFMNKSGKVNIVGPTRVGKSVFIKGINKKLHTFKILEHSSFNSKIQEENINILIIDQSKHSYIYVRENKENIKKSIDIIVINNYVDINIREKEYNKLFKDKKVFLLKWVDRELYLSKKVDLDAEYTENINYICKYIIN